ncbi:MAG: histidine--tRNA ligase [Deltaproteobacteria bacterium]|nr:histidine--tRNA ligase [Deltaproteobacteria bacterium]
MSDERLSTQPYKGTRDFYPRDMRQREFVFDRIRNVLKSFGYVEYGGPMLEPLALYAAKTSEEIVKEQLYSLTDRGNRELAIRPEMTPTLARMVAARQNELPRPIRWFSIPNLWRYERPQRGRLREHWQVNVDVFGGEPLAEDLEICQVIVAIMEAFEPVDSSQTTTPPKRYEVRLNHRGLLNSVFQTKLKLSPGKIPAIGRLLDAAPKMGMDAFAESLVTEGLDDAQIGFLKDLFEKDATDRLKREFSGEPFWNDFSNLLVKLDALNIGSHFRFDPSIMRGFLYYTGTVLEVYDLHPDNSRALFGGGHYDNLVGLFGGKPLPGVGFGMGDVTFMNYLETHGLLPRVEAPEGIFIAHLEESLLIEAQKLAAELRREAGAAGVTIPIMTALETGKIKKHFTAAEKLGARAIVFVGGNEVATGTFPIKHLAKGVELRGDKSKLLTHYLSWN